jgi:chloramphenicol 3-O phosphotransferase
MGGVHAVPTCVIVLNGTSSAGKSTLAAGLQDALDGTWLCFGTDTLMASLPARLGSGNGGVGVGPDGAICFGADYRAAEAAWLVGLAAMTRSGARVILDEVFTEGAADQRRRREALVGLGVLWVGVRCDPAVTAARELARGDRQVGLSALQERVVHAGVDYDVEVDTTCATPTELAAVIAAHVT